MCSGFGRSPLVAAHPLCTARDRSHGGATGAHLALRPRRQSNRRIDEHEVVQFHLDEYVRAERGFIYDTIHALARARGGIVSEIQTEPTDRIRTTQVTTDSGGTVRFEPFAVKAGFKLMWEAIEAGDADALLVALDDAAEEYHEGLSKAFYGGMERLTEGTGLQVDAAGRPFFDSYYEMLEKVEIPFEYDGSISDSWVLVASPETAEVIEKARAAFTPEQQAKLDALIDRKRSEALARRRTRRLS